MPSEGSDGAARFGRAGSVRCQAGVHERSFLDPSVDSDATQLSRADREAHTASSPAVLTLPRAEAGLQVSALLRCVRMRVAHDASIDISRGSLADPRRTGAQLTAGSARSCVDDDRERITEAVSYVRAARAS